MVVAMGWLVATSVAALAVDAADENAPPASVCGGWPVPGHTAWVNVRYTRDDKHCLHSLPADEWHCSADWNTR